MFALSKRRFIQLAGLSIANRIVPNRLCGAAKQASAEAPLRFCRIYFT